MILFSTVIGGIYRVSASGSIPKRVVPIILVAEGLGFAAMLFGVMALGENIINTRQGALWAAT